MPTSLNPIHIPSIYFDKNKKRVNLPERMAQCTPDTRRAVLSLRMELDGRGVKLFLSDMFRSHDMQLQAHFDNAKKGVFSPLPGGSMHEAGRAFDLDLTALLADNILTLADFWKIAEKHGVAPIIAKPKANEKEAWHFDCRGSHSLVRQYYLDGKGGNNMKPYEAMSASAILAIGVQVDRFKNQKAASIQSALIRLGHELGAFDGSVGPKTKIALSAAGIPETDEETMFQIVEDKVRQKFPNEFE